MLHAQYPSEYWEFDIDKFLKLVPTTSLMYAHRPSLTSANLDTPNFYFKANMGPQM